MDLYPNNKKFKQEIDIPYVTKIHYCMICGTRKINMKKKINKRK